MPSINMIAPRRAERQRLERDMRRLVYVILAELIIAVGIGGWMFTRIVTTNAQIDNLKAELLDLQPKVDEIQRYEKLTQQLKPKLDLLNQAKTSTMRWYDVLDKLTQVLPDSSYLTFIGSGNGNDKNSEPKVNIRGVSNNQANVGELMLRLNTIPEFDTIDLHFTSNKTIGETPCVDFEVGAVMKSDEPKKEVTRNG